MKKKENNIYKARTATIKAANPKSPETVIAEAPEDGEIGPPPEGDGAEGLLIPTVVILAQAMRPPALL